jgi:hypothetical protein
MKTELTITIEQLKHLEKDVTTTSLKIRKIRIAAERGDISLKEAALQLKHIGIIHTKAKP